MQTQAKDIFEAQSKSLFELLSGNGLGLYLPPYQRPYGWSRDKVEKLLDDTLHGLKNLSEQSDSFTFLGTVITIHDVNHVSVNPIVKHEVPGKVLTVIDGQQRLSTLLLLLVALHNQITQQFWRVFKGQPPSSEDMERSALYSEVKSILNSLLMTFCEKQSHGEFPIYPRLIRAFVDQWSKDSRRQYESPIANLVFSYAESAAGGDGAGKPRDFRPQPRPGVGEGETDLVSRYNEIRLSLDKLSKRTEIEALESLPDLAQIAQSMSSQRALFNRQLDPNLCDWLKKLEDEPEASLMRLIVFAAYALNRIALTVVQGKDEDYAFTIFESLNTTGEPLTAFETFLPRVVLAEEIRNYQDSESYEHMRSVQNYLDRFGVGDRLQNATRDLLVSFALAETGKKLSKRLPDQRSYMKMTFDRHKDDANERYSYLGHLSNTATFIGAAWEPPKDTPRQLPGLPAAAMTDSTKLCLSFLTDLNHSIAIAPLVRFYSSAVNLEESEDQDRAVAEFESAIKAIAAFTVFWRGSRRGTGNIDAQHRAILSGDSLTDMGPLARTLGQPGKSTALPAVDADALKLELVARLEREKYGNIPDLETFIRNAAQLPIYKMSRTLSRFILLSAYHDSIEDAENPGLIKVGRAGVSPCFTADGWLDETHLTLEHIAPKQKTVGWDEGFYADNETVHKIGNLVLTPVGANSSLSSRPWSEKRVLYAALGATSNDEAAKILTQSGISFAQSTEDLAAMSRYLPHLSSLGSKLDEWTPEFVEVRSRAILKLAYLRLKDWLGLDWSAS